MDGVERGTITYPTASCGRTNDRADGLILISSRGPSIWELRKMTSNPQGLSRSIVMSGLRIREAENPGKAQSVKTEASAMQALC